MKYEVGALVVVKNGKHQPSVLATVVECRLHPGYSGRDYYTYRVHRQGKKNPDTSTMSHHYIVPVEGGEAEKFLKDRMATINYRLQQLDRKRQYQLSQKAKVVGFLTEIGGSN